MSLAITTTIVLCSVAICAGLLCLLYTAVGMLQEFVLGGHRASQKCYLNTKKHERRDMDSETATAIQRAFTVARHGG